MNLAHWFALNKLFWKKINAKYQIMFYCFTRYHYHISTKYYQLQKQKYHQQKGSTSNFSSIILKKTEFYFFLKSKYSFSKFQQQSWLYEKPAP